MQKNNNQLYDAIINNVAKEVKRAINETWEDVEKFRKRLSFEESEAYAKDIALGLSTDPSRLNLEKIPNSIVSICENNPERIEYLYERILDYIEKYIEMQIGGIDQQIQEDLNNMKLNQNSYLELDDIELNKYIRSIDKQYSFTYHGKYICMFDLDRQEELNLSKKLEQRRQNIDIDIFKIALCTFESSKITRIFSKLFLWMVRLCLETNCEELIDIKVFNLTNILTKKYKADPHLILKMINLGSLLKNGLLAKLWFKKAQTNYQMAVSTSPVVIANSVISSSRRIFLGKKR